MTNKEKLIAIIGEENFRKLDRNFDGDISLDCFIKKEGANVLLGAFAWSDTEEGNYYWRDLYRKVTREWEDVSLRKITNEEQELLFKMFCMEWMEYPQGDNERWYETVFSEGVGLKVYEALRSE